MYPVPYHDKHVLVVDDMTEMRNSLRSQIASLAIQKVSVAGSVRDALEYIKKQKFDIILCDYNLGDVAYAADELRDHFLTQLPTRPQPRIGEHPGNLAEDVQ